LYAQDKNPNDFFDAISALEEASIEFRIAVVGLCHFDLLFSSLLPPSSFSSFSFVLSVESGEQFDESPPIFEEMKGKIAQHKIRAWGFLPDKQSYYDLLSESDVVVSTTLHEVPSLLSSLEVLFFCIAF